MSKAEGDAAGARQNTRDTSGLIVFRATERVQTPSVCGETERMQTTEAPRGHERADRVKEYVDWKLTAKLLLN